jgi:transcriptional regulator with XRE-family HTH domain
MHFITFLRTSLNCAQADFAGLFNVSVSTISRAEKDRAQLPHGSNYIIKLIHERLVETDQSKKKKPQQIDGMDLEMLRQIELRTNEVALILIKLKNELDLMISRYNIASTAYRYTSAITADPGKMGGHQKAWLRGQLERQALLMEKNNAMARYQLELRIAQLELELQMNKAVIYRQA